MSGDCRRPRRMGGPFRRPREPTPEHGRGQANLAAVAASVVVLVTVTVLAVAIAEGALVDADRDPVDRRVAATTADRLVEAESLALREGVLNRSAVGNLTVADVDRLAPPAGNRSIRVALDGTTVVERGDPAGVTVRRTVLVGARDRRTRTTPLSESVTLAERTDRLTVDLDPNPNTTVEAVRVNDRIVLRDTAGLEGRHRVPVSRYANATVAFDLSGNRTGTATLIARPTNASGADLAVTVGD